MRAVTVEGARQAEPRRLLFGEVLDALDAAQVQAAIDRRVQAIPECVGQLYPAIMCAEIAKLRARARELQ